MDDRKMDGYWQRVRNAHEIWNCTLAVVISSSCNRYILLPVKARCYVPRAAWCMVVKDSGRILFREFYSLSLSLFLNPSSGVTRRYTRMFYDTQFSHVSRSQFLKAHPRPPWVKIRGGFHRWENREISLSEIKVLRHTRKSVKAGYDVREKKEERKTKGEKPKNVKQEEQRRTQKRAPESATICVYTQPSRPLGIIYPLLLTSFCLLLFFFSYVNLSGFLFLAFRFPVFGIPALHRAVCSCWLRFIIPQLFRIHTTPLQSLLC